MKKKKLKRQNRQLLNKCTTLQRQVDALVETYMKYIHEKRTTKVSDWIEEEAKRQMRRANATS